MTQLHQINLSFDAEQDRLLLRVSTTDPVEHSLWLTRRLVKAWWPVLLQLASHRELRRRPQAPEAARAAFEFAHESAVQGANFAAPYEAPPTTAAPILVAEVRMRPLAAEANELLFIPRQGQPLTMNLPEPMLHALLKLLQQAVAQAGWDIQLQLPAGSLAATTRVN